MDCKIPEKIIALGLKQFQQQTRTIAIPIYSNIQSIIIYSDRF